MNPKFTEIKELQTIKGNSYAGNKKHRSFTYTKETYKKLLNSGSKRAHQADK